jgi:hypothetical protein
MGYRDHGEMLRSSVTTGRGSREPKRLASDTRCHATVVAKEDA